MGNKHYDSIMEQVPGLTYNGATGHVFKLMHGQHKQDLAWHPEKRWTQMRNGRVYTYNEAVNASIYGEIPEEGRWYAIGKIIYLVE